MRENYDDILAKYVSEFSLPIRNLELLGNALTHKSFVENTNNTIPDYSNDTLEFLGDSILGYVISSYLYIQHPNYDQGILTKKKSNIVSKVSLSKIANNLEIDKVIRTRGMRKEDILSSNILADAVEALIAAIYLSEGLEVVRNFILQIFKYIIHETVNSENYQDAKSILQEYCQKHFNVRPKYILVATDGPDHRKQYTTKLQINQDNFGPCTSFSKKHSEQLVAEVALRYFTN